MTQISLKKSSKRFWKEPGCEDFTVRYAVSLVFIPDLLNQYETVGVTLAGNNAIGNELLTVLTPVLVRFMSVAVPDIVIVFEDIVEYADDDDKLFNLNDIVPLPVTDIDDVILEPSFCTIDHMLESLVLLNDMSIES